MSTLEKSPLERLAALAPQEKGPTPGRGKKVSSRGSQRSELGPLDVGKYLDHHGIQYSTKQKGNITIYPLGQCVFDPGHTKNEAAICQDQSGLLTYQCFHNSCHGKTWADARQIISGNESLAPFCRGYDPNWKRPHSTQTQKPPLMEDQKPFLTVSEKGRAKFNPAIMANHLEKKLAPLLFEGKESTDLFYRYDPSGVWNLHSRDAIRNRVRKQLGNHAKTSWIEEPIAVLEAQTFRMPDELVFNPMWLNVKNGMLHVETMELRPHAPEFNSRAQLPVKYDEKATSSMWIETVAEIFADDLAKADVLQDFFGYCLYPRILFPAAVFQIGEGRNGKGVIEKILCAMLGKANVSHVSLARMNKPFGPAEIRDKLLNSCGETEAGPLDVTNFKNISAGDEIQAEVKYKSDIKFTPIAKHMISMNAFPGVKEKTDSFFRRIIVLEYKQKFEGQADDKRLADKLMGELDSIFMWSLQGLMRVLKNEEIARPEAVVLAKERFRERVNPVLSFVKEVCLLDREVKQGGIRMLPADLYREYQEWMEDAKLRPLGKQNFYEQIRLNFPHVKKMRESYGTREYFYGIGLRQKD